MYYTLPMSRLVIHLILRETLNAEKTFCKYPWIKFSFFTILRFLYFRLTQKLFISSLND